MLSDILVSLPLPVLIGLIACGALLGFIVITFCIYLAEKKNKKSETAQPASAKPAPAVQPAQPVAAKTEPAVQPAPVIVVNEEPAGPAEKPVEEVPAEEAAEEISVEEPVEEPAPAEDIVEEAADEPSEEEPVEEPAPVEEIAPAEDVVEETADEPSEEEAVEEPAPAEEIAPAEDVVEEAADEPAEEPVPENIPEVLSVAEATRLMHDEEAKTKVIVSERVSDTSHRVIVNVDTLGEYFNDGERVTLAEMKKRIPFITKKVTYVKVLARGVLSKRLLVEADDFSLDAVKMIVLKGGKVYRTRTK